MSDPEATSNPASPEAEPEQARPTSGDASPADPLATVADPAGAPSADDAAPAPPAPDAGEASSKASEAKPAAARASYVFLGVVTLVSLVLDLWSKYWAKAHFEALRPRGHRQVVVIEDAVSFIFAKNRGGAWGLLQNETEALRRPFFLIVSVAAIVFIVSLYRKLQPGQTALKWGLPLVLGGALGNLVDRIRYGYVVDFIDVYMKFDGKVKHWPTFNVADIAICIGVGLMAVDMFTSRREHKPAAAAPVDTASTSASAAEPPSSAPVTPAPDAEAPGPGEERAAASDGDSPSPATPVEGI